MLWFSYVRLPNQSNPIVQLSSTGFLSGLTPHIKVICMQMQTAERGKLKSAEYKIDRPYKQHCGEAGSPHSRMYQAFLSPLPCNDDSHNDFRIRAPFGRNSSGFPWEEYLRRRARMTRRICLHFSLTPCRTARRRPRKAEKIT